MIKILQKNKINKIIMGINIFLCAVFILNPVVFAYDKCNSWDGKTKASCNAQNENGFACTYTTEYTDAFDLTGKKVCKVNYKKCAKGYESTGNGCKVIKKETDRCTSITYNDYGAAQDEVCNAAHQYTTGLGYYSDDGACKYGQKNGTWGCYLASDFSSSSSSGSSSSGSSSSGSSSSGSSSSGSSSSGSSSSGSSSQYNIWFDSNYGSGLTCSSPFTQSNSNPVVCNAKVKSGSSVNFPTSDIVNGEGLHILGWSSTLYNGALVCSSDAIEKKDSFKASSDKYYYACFKEDIGGYRYAAKGYVADGGAENYPCGSSIWIEYCINDGTDDYCYYNENGTMRKVYRYKLTGSESTALATCSSTSTEEPSESTSGTSTINDYRYVTKDSSKYSCGDALYITACTDNLCDYTKVKSSASVKTTNGTVDRNLLKNSETEAKNNCDEEVEEDEFEKLKSCSNEPKQNMSGTRTYKDFCYKEDLSKDEIIEKISSVYTCEKGYSITTVYNEDEEKTCNTKGICVNDFSITCSKVDNKPTLSVSSGTVQSNGYGSITVKANAKQGKIVAYFASDYYLLPTSINKWVNIDSSTFTLDEVSPGIKYIWVKDSYGNVSNAVSGAVFDTVNNDTTVKKLELYDDKGNLQTPDRVTAYNDSVKSSKYVMLSNQLGKDSEVLADGFNPYDMEYKLEVSSPTVTVYATLTSTDSKYVEGYEPRTVNLDYGINTVLIKIQNKEGKIRTYTILVTRVDDRTSDNTLSDLSVSVGEINFNANVTDYKIEVPSSTTTVDVSSTIASSVASYESGYEPGSVVIEGDTTVKLIKVKSETGSTRTYVLTFIKEGTDEIIKKSLQLADLVIPNVYVPFEEDVANYSFSVDYGTDKININTTKNDENSKVIISAKRKSDNTFGVVSSEGIALDVGENFIEITVIDSDGDESHYRLTIIRKEFGLEISNDTTLKDLSVLGYDIDYKPEKKEYTVRIKQEKSLVITAVPNSNRAEVFIRGNEELTGFSTVRVKVVAENGEYETYSIDIKKDAFNKTIEIAAIVAGVVIILISGGIIIVKKKTKANKEYFEE